MPHRAKSTDADTDASPVPSTSPASPESPASPASADTELSLGNETSNEYATASLGTDTSNSCATLTASGQSNRSTEDSKGNQDKVVVDTMMAVPRFSRSDSMKSLIEGARKRREDYMNIALMFFMLMLVILNLYYAATYNPADSGCSTSEGTLNVGVFCLMAGMMSLPFAIISYVMWRKGRSPSRPTRNSKAKQSAEDSSIGVGKIVFCFTFWNLVLAFIGMSMYFGQFDLACQSEPIAIFILIWSMTQFALACTAISAGCYLIYHLTAKSQAADDVIGAGFAFDAA